MCGGTQPFSGCDVTNPSGALRYATHSAERFQMPISFPDDLLIINANENRAQRLDTFKGDKIITFVSKDCPVSMVETVIKVHQLADQNKNVRVIVAPLQKLSEKHLVKTIRLPLFVQIKEDFESPGKSAQFMKLAE